MLKRNTTRAALLISPVYFQQTYRRIVQPESIIDKYAFLAPERNCSRANDCYMCEHVCASCCMSLCLFVQLAACLCLFACMFMRVCSINCMSLHVCRKTNTNLCKFRQVWTFLSRFMQVCLNLKVSLCMSLHVCAAVCVFLSLPSAFSPALAHISLVPHSVAHLSLTLHLSLSSPLRFSHPCSLPFPSPTHPPFFYSILISMAKCNKPCKEINFTFHLQTKNLLARKTIWLFQ